MSPARSSALRRAAPMAWVVALALLVAVLSLHRMSNNDIWLHLKTGEIILEEGAIPRVERYSFTAVDRPVVPHEWAAAVLFALVHSAAGVTGLIFMRLILAGAACAALVAAARGMGARLPVLTGPLALALVLASARLLVRPHLWSYVLGAVFLLLLDRHRRRRGRLVFLLIPLQVAWANLHGGFPLGWLLLGAFAAGELVPVVRRRAWHLLRERRQVRDLGVLAAALPLACLLNPSGYRLLLFPFRVIRVDVFMNLIYEWQPPFWPRYRGTFMFLEYMALAGLALAVLLLRLRGGPRWALLAGVGLAAGGIATGAGALVAAGVLVAGAAAALARGAVPPAHAFLILGLFYWSTTMNRAVTDFALLSLPPVAALLDRWLRRRASPLWTLPSRRPEPCTLAGAGLFVVLALAVGAGGYWYGPSARREPGIGLARTTPVAAADFLERTGIGERVFADYAAASYLVWRLHPRLRVFFDSRNEVYGESVAREFHAAKAGGGALSRTLDRHAVDTAVVAVGPGAAMVAELQARRDFALVHFDDLLAVYTRRTAANAALLADLAYVHLSPLRLDPNQVTRELAPAVSAEARRALESCDDCLIPRSALAEAAFVEGRMDEAAELWRQIAARWPDLFLAQMRLGDVYVFQGNSTGAMVQYQIALRLRPDSPQIMRRLQFLGGQDAPPGTAKEPSGSEGS